MQNEEKFIVHYYINEFDELISLNEFLENFNRQQRRELIKYKENTDKISFIVSDTTLHQIFIAYLMQHFKIKESPNLSIEFLENIKYEEEEKLYIVLNLIKNEFKFKSKKSEVVDIIKKIIYNNNQFVEGDNDFMDQENNKEMYICVFEIRNSFINFYPKYRIKDDIFYEIEIDQEYPPFGSINVATNTLQDAELINDKLDAENNSIWILYFDSKRDITDNKDSYGDFKPVHKKISQEMLIYNNVITSNVISINTNNIFEIINFEYDNIILNKIDLNDKYIVLNKNKAYFIKNKDYIYGPYIFKDGGKAKFLIPQYDYTLKKIGVLDSRRIVYEIKVQSSTKEIINLNSSLLKYEEIDVMSDDILVNEFRKSIGDQDFKILKDFKIEKFNLNFTENRINRIKEILCNAVKFNKTTEDIEEIFREFILSDSSESSEKFITKILNSPDFVRKLQNLNAVKEEKDRQDNKLKSINFDIERELKKLEEIKNSQVQINMIEVQKKIEIELNSESKKLDQIRSEIEEKEDYLCNLDKNINSYEELVKDIEYKRKQLEDLNQDTYRREENVKKIEKILSEKIDKSLEVFANGAFDNILTRVIIGKNNEWRNANRTDNQQKLAYYEYLENKRPVNYDKYFINKVRSKRSNYKKNEILNIFICISQGFLTVFAGEPGVGKTSICNIVAEALGIKNHKLFDKDKNEITINRFVEISVEKDWSSKKDLIGYYNPITKTINKNNSEFFEALVNLDIENRMEINKLPFLVLLDEANLSQMEHYWADFMNVCDLDKFGDRTINLGEEYVFNLPKTLRFLATINYDSTTEVLSPRLIDRAWIILLEQDKINNHDKIEIELDNLDAYEEDMIIFYEDLMMNYVKSNSEIRDDIKESLNQIYDKFEKQDINIGMRTKNMINNYLKVGQDILESTEYATSSFVALDYAISQKLLPRLNGQGEDFKNFLEELKEYFNNNERNMIKSRDLVSKIIKMGELNLGYFQFFC